MRNSIPILVSKMRKVFEYIRLGAAGGLTGVADYLGIKFADILSKAPWTEASKIASPFLSVYGVGELGKAISQTKKDKETGYKPNWVEKVGRTMKTAPVASAPLSYATDHNALSLVIPGSLCVLGYIVEELGKQIRK